MGSSILGLAKSIYYTFQAFEENSFTIISKKIRIILDNESSAFTRTGLQFWKLKSSLRSANDGRHLTAGERVHHGLFLRPHHGWIHGEILSLKTWKWNWFSLDAVIDGPANVCGTGAFMFTGASGATVVVMPQTAIRFFFSVALPGQLHRNCQGIVRFCGLWLWQYLSVQRLLSSTCWLLSFLHCDLWTFCDFLQVPATIVFIMLLIVPFSPIGWVLNQRLSSNPRFLLILR